MPTSAPAIPTYCTGAGKATSIKQFFENSGHPPTNSRQPWGAQSGDAILLIAWVDDPVEARRIAAVLRDPVGLVETEPENLNERISHLRSLWHGWAAGYAAIATATAPDSLEGEVGLTPDYAAFAIRRIEQRTDMPLVAMLGDS